MKESYKYTEGNVIVTDVRDNDIFIIERPYQDNIEEILKTENIIEALENEKKNYEESITIKKNRINRKRKKNRAIITASIMIGLFASLIHCLTNPFSNVIAIIGILSALGSFSLLSPTFFNNLKSIEMIKNELNGLNLAGKVLESKKKEAKLLLNKLRNDKSQSKIKSISNKITRVNYLESLKELKSLLVLYCSIGANESYFQKLYKDGMLDLKLFNDFSNEDIAEIKTYFKTKK